MIWQLIKRDSAWQVMPFIALMMILPALFIPGRSGGGVSFLLTIPFILSLAVPGFRQRCTVLQTTLPIDARQLFLARIGSLMACIWVPILSAVAITAAVRSDLTSPDRLPLFEAGAAITAAMLLMQCVRPSTVDPPDWIVVTAYVVMFCPLLMLGEFFLSQPVAVRTGVLGGCALLSAALFFRAWAVIPKSFQLVPAEPVSARSGEGRRAWPAPIWLPVLRSLYGWQAGVSLLVVFITMEAGGTVFALCMAVPPFFITCRLGLRWLLHLPISARKLFWAIWLPITATMFAGLVLPSEIDLTRRLYVLPKARMVVFAVILLAWMVQICALQLHGWKGLRDKSGAVRTMLAGAPSFLGYAIFMAQMFRVWARTAPRGRDPLFDAFVLNLASVLPDNLWLIGLIAALPIAGLYFLAEKLFREMEFGQIEIQAQRVTAR